MRPVRVLVGTTLALFLGLAPLGATGPDDVVFIKGLLARKYYDLAAAAAKDAEANTDNNDHVRGLAAFLLGDIYRAWGDAQNDQAMKAKAGELTETAKQRYPNHQRAQVATVDKVNRLVIDGRNQRAQAESDPGHRDELRAAAKAKFQETIDTAKPILADLLTRAQEIDKAEEKTFPKSQQWFDAWLQHNLLFKVYAEAHLEKALTEPRSDEDLRAGLEEYGKIEEDFYQVDQITWDGYLGKARCLLELKQYEEAYDVFMALTEITYNQLDLDVVKKNNEKFWLELREKLLDTRLQGYLRAAEALLAWGKPAEARELISNMRSSLPGKFPEFKKVLERPYAQIAVLKLAAALIEQGDGAGALEEVAKLIDAARAAEDKVVGAGMNAFGVESCKEMAKLYEKTQGLSLNARLAFYVGKGYYFLQQFDKALPRLQEAEAGTGADAAMAEFAILALMDLGTIHYKEKRYREAGGAFEGIYQRWAGHELAQKAAEQAKLSWREVRGQGAAEEEAYQRAEKYVLEHAGAGGIVVVKTQFDNAMQAFGEGRFAEAHEGFQAVPPKVEEREVSFYDVAQILDGVSLFKLFLAEPEQRAADKDPALKQVREGIERARARKDQDAVAMGAYYLGAELLCDPKVGDAAGALVVLAEFESALRASKYAFSSLARALGLAVAAGDLKGARRIAGVLEKGDGQNPDLPGVIITATVAADAAAKAKGAEEGAESARFAGEFAQRWLKLSPQATHTDRNWVAGLLVDAGGKDNLKAAEAIYQGIDDQLKSKTDASEDEKLMRVGVRIGQARILIVLEDFAKAVTVYRELFTDFPSDESVLEGLGRACLGQYRGADPKDERLLDGETPPGALVAYIKLKQVRESQREDLEAKLEMLPKDDTAGREQAAAAALAKGRQFWEAQIAIWEIEILRKNPERVKQAIKTYEVLGELRDFKYPDIMQRIEAFKKGP